MANSSALYCGQGAIRRVEDGDWSGWAALLSLGSSLARTPALGWEASPPRANRQRQEHAGSWGCRLGVEDDLGTLPPRLVEEIKLCS